MIPKIFVSPSLEKRKEKIQEELSFHHLTNPHPDILYLAEGTKLGVEAAKQIREFLTLKPYQAKGRAIVVESADKFSLDAQNSLLKTLEEPPEESLFLIGSHSENSLLPTILSRCELHILIETKEKTKGPHFDEIKKMLEMNVPSRFDFIEKVDEKEDFLVQLISYYQEKLLANPENLRKVKILLEAERWHKANGNIRAILEYLVLVL